MPESTQKPDPAYASGIDCAAGPPVPFDFVEVVNHYETPLLRYANLLMAPESDGAEEAVQEAFLRLHRQMLIQRASNNGNPDKNKIDNIEQWLFRVVHNCVIDNVRRRKSNERTLKLAARDKLANGGTNCQSNVLKTLIDAEMHARVLAEVKRLTYEHKQVLLLKIIRGFTFREIGKITGLSVSNVSHRLNQALQELARRMKQAGHLAD